ncbi:MAG: superoxide dismutase [Gammaproteobacteria bacterium]
MSLKLPPLPYALDELEPHLSRLTLSLHYGRHHAAYLERTVHLVRHTPLETAPLEQIVRSSAANPDRRLFHAAAQSWNHDFYWRGMKTRGGGKPYGAAARLVDESFGDYPTFCQEFIRTASELFGSGWTWLVLDGDRLRIASTGNADTPLISSRTPLLACDVWEHAYYPDYQNRRMDYVAAFLTHLVNWDFVNANLETRAAGRVLPPVRQ